MVRSALISSALNEYIVGFSEESVTMEIFILTPYCKP